MEATARESIELEKEKHMLLIKQEFKVPSELANSLSKENLAAVEKYGTWMSALEKKEILPITDEQFRFLEVCEGFQVPENRIEIAWYNFKKVSSRIAGGSFGYHASENTTKRVVISERCNACDRNVDFCICGR